MNRSEYEHKSASINGHDIYCRSSFQFNGRSSDEPCDMFLAFK